MNRRDFIKGLGALALSVAIGCKKKDEQEWPITPIDETSFSVKHIAPPLVDNMGIDLSKVYEVSSGWNVTGGGTYSLSVYDLDAYYSEMFQKVFVGMMEDVADA